MQTKDDTASIQDQGQVQDQEQDQEDVSTILHTSKSRAIFWDSFLSKDSNLRFRWEAYIEPVLPSCPEPGCDNLKTELGLSNKKASSFGSAIESGAHAGMIDALYDHGYMPCIDHATWQPSEMVMDPPQSPHSPLRFTTCDTIFRPVVNSDNLEEQCEMSESIGWGRWRCLVQVPDYRTQSGNLIPSWPFQADGGNRCSVRHASIVLRSIYKAERGIQRETANDMPQEEEEVEEGTLSHQAQSQNLKWEESEYTSQIPSAAAGGDVRSTFRNRFQIRQSIYSRRAAEALHDHERQPQASSWLSMAVMQDQEEQAASSMRGVDIGRHVPSEWPTLVDPEEEGVEPYYDWIDANGSYVKVSQSDFETV
ncbi:hypothetical protein IAR50_006164 [Cryptococcus sp. DSM 104548]